MPNAAKKARNPEHTRIHSYWGNPAILAEVIDRRRAA